MGGDGAVVIVTTLGIDSHQPIIESAAGGSKKQITAIVNGDRLARDHSHRRRIKASHKRAISRHKNSTL